MTPDYPLMIVQLNKTGIKLDEIVERTGIRRDSLSKISSEGIPIPQAWQNIDIDDEMLKAVSLCILYKLTFNNRALPDLHNPWN